MNPFKIGDKVRIVARTHGHEERVGTTLTIGNTYPERHTFNYQLRGSDWYFDHSELELVYNFRDYVKAVNQIRQ